ncbi:hypothetical protein ABIF90_008387 [Bradyrhizobium japonicum]
MNPGAENIHCRPVFSRCVAAVPASPSSRARRLLGPVTTHLSAASRPCRPPPEILSASAALHLRQERCRPGGGASAATGAGAWAVPRAVRVVLANPAEVVTVGARCGRGTGRRRLTLATRSAGTIEGDARIRYSDASAERRPRLTGESMGRPGPLRQLCRRAGDDSSIRRSCGSPKLVFPGRKPRLAPGKIW